MCSCRARQERRDSLCACILNCGGDGEERVLLRQARARKRTNIDGGLFGRLVVWTKRGPDPDLFRGWSGLLPVRRCHSFRQPASPTNTRQVQNDYEGQFHVSVQPHASSTSQNVVRIHDSDRDRVTIANKVIIRFIAQRVIFFPSSTPCAHVLWRATSFLVQSTSESWTPPIGCA